MADITRDQRIAVGSVVQLNERASDECYIGCLLIVTEVRSWGVQGFIPVPHERGKPAGHVFLRPKWEALEWVGTAVLQPANENDDE